MKHKEALLIASELVGRFSIFCERIQIAGSLRREKPDVGDIEIVAAPQMVSDLFGGKVPVTNGVDWGQYGRVNKSGPRYCQIALPEGINLDLFLVYPPAQWGVIFALRTGPAEFSKWLVTRRNQRGALPSDCQVKDGVVWRRGEPIPMPEEEDFFKFIGLPILPPVQRSDFDVKKVVYR